MRMADSGIDGVQSWPFSWPDRLTQPPLVSTIGKTPPRCGPVPRPCLPSVKGVIPWLMQSREMLAFGFQRFFLFEVGNMNIAIVVSIMKFSECVVMRRSFNPRVKNPDFLELGDVVINNHSFAAHDGHFPDFPRIQPTAVNDGRPISRKIEPHGCHILHPRGDVRTALTVDGNRFSFHDVQNNGDIMGSQIPGNIDVFLKKPKIQPPRANVADFSDVASLDNFLDFSDRRRIKEGMPHHQHQSLFLRNFDQFLAFLRKRRPSAFR